jgi:uncharacterized protein (UPF0276 family)
MPARAGIGLRAQHHDDLLRDRPDIGWLEAHSENYFADGGAQIDYLLALRELYPLSLHGVGLSLGSVDPLDRDHLWRLKRLVHLAEPALVSEHLSWGAVDGTHLNDLLPLPYTQEALHHMVARVGELQDYLGRQVLIENVSSYLQFANAQMTEWEFLQVLADRSGCGLLLDVNNVYVSARNHGFSPDTYLAGLPIDRVGQIHLAGHTDMGAYLFDTHDGPVIEPVWELYGRAVRRFGRVSTLVEWDDHIPALEVVCVEAERARAIESAVLTDAHAVPA